MVYVLETTPGTFTPELPQQLVSLDGERRAALGVVLHESWTSEERAAFGLFEVQAGQVPNGRRVTSVSYARVDGQIVQQVETEAIPVLPRMVAVGAVKVASGVPSSIVGSGFSGVTRLTAGRIRFFFDSSQPDRDYIATPGMHHSTATDLRISAKTEDYVELRSTAEALEYSLTVMRIA